MTARLLRSAAALGVALLLGRGAGAADFDPFPELVGVAGAGCASVRLVGNAETSSRGLASEESPTEAGHLRSNGDITLDGTIVVRGDALAGPGRTVVRKGNVTVTGASGAAPAPYACRPVDLAALAGRLAATHDNARIGRTAKGRDPLKGAARSDFELSANDSIVLASGSYLFTSFRLVGSSSVSVSGDVRILVTGPVELGGGSRLHDGGSPFALRLWCSGASLRIGQASSVTALVYAPDAAASVVGASRVVGSLLVASLDVDGGSSLVRELDDRPPTLAVTEPLAGATVPDPTRVVVRGTVSDAEGPVTLLVEGHPVAPEADGSFSATVDLSGQSPMAVDLEATDGSGNRTTLVVPVVGGGRPPTLVLDTPEAGALLGTRVVPLAGRCADTATVVVGSSSVPCAAGLFTVSSWDLGAEGSVTIALSATNPSGTTRLAVPLVVDTRPPQVLLDPLPSCVAAAAIEPVPVSGRAVDPHLAPGPIRIEATGADGTTQAIEVVPDAAGLFRTAVAAGSAGGTTVLTAVAVDLLAHEGRAIRSFGVDATAPTVELREGSFPFPGAAPGEVPAAGAEPVVVARALRPTAVVRDAGAVEFPEPAWTLDGAPFAAGGEISAEGTHLLGVRAVDCAGHVASAHALFRIDRTPPTLASTEPADGAVLAAGPTGYAGVAGEPLASARVAGGDATVDGVAFARTPFAAREGVNEVEIELEDRAGNRSVVRRRFTLRTLAPTVEILLDGAPARAGAIFLGPVAVEVRSNDPAATRTVTLDGAGWTVGGTVSTDGAHEVVAVATDPATGHASTATASFRIDRSGAPSVAITEPADGTVVGEPSVDVSGSASAGVVSVTVAGRPATLASGSWSLDALPLEADLPTEIVVVAADAAGRTASDRRTVTFRSGPPRIVLLSPADGTLTNRARVDLVGQVVGGANLLGGGTLQVSGLATPVPVEPSGAFRAVDVPLAAGENLLSATGVDREGRSSRAEVRVVSDRRPPVVLLSLADGTPLVDGAGFASAVTVRLSATDDGASLPSLSVRLDGETLEGTGATRDLPIAEPGGHRLEAIARDAAGNETRAARGLSIRGAAGCAFADLQPADGSAVAADRVTVSGRAPNAVTVRIRPAGETGGVEAPVVDGTFARAGVPLPRVGENRLELACVDATGVETVRELPLRRLGDGAPVVVLSAPTDGSIVASDRIDAAGTVSDGEARVRVAGADAVVTPEAGGAGRFARPAVTLAEGPNILVARATDAAGRTGTARALVVRDTAPTALSIASPRDGDHLGLPADGGALVVDVAGLFDRAAERPLPRIVVRAAGSEVVADVDEGGRFVAPALPLPAAAGEVTIEAIATDRGGATARASIRVTVDPAGPRLVLVAPEELARASAGDAVSVSGTILAAEGSRVRIGGALLAPEEVSWGEAASDGRRAAAFSRSLVVPSGDGPWPVVVRVDDPEGRSATASRTLRRDDLAPRLLETVPAAGAPPVDPSTLPLVLFSEPVRPASLAAAGGVALLGSDGLPRAVSFEVSGAAVAVVPSAPLVAGERLRLSVGAGVLDLVGNPLAEPVTVEFDVAADPGGTPAVDPLPATVCAASVTVRGSAPAGGTVRVRDGSREAAGVAGADGRFAVEMPLSGAGFHRLEIALVGVGGIEGPRVERIVRLDCGAPTVVGATVDRAGGRVRFELSEEMDADTLPLPGAFEVRAAADPAGAPARPSSLTVASGGKGVELVLGTDDGSWWADAAVRLAAGPPARDLSGNELVPWSSLVPVGDSVPSDGGLVAGEVYDDATGRPLAGAVARLAASVGGAPVGEAVSDGRGRFGLSGELVAGRWTLVLSAGAEDRPWTRVVRRVSVEPGSVAIPLDARLTPLAAPLDPPLDGVAGGTVADAAGRRLHLPAGLAGLPARVAVRLTPLSAQGLPELLPPGWSPGAAVRVDLADAASSGLLGEGAARPLPGCWLELPIPGDGADATPWVAARADLASGLWLVRDVMPGDAPGTLRVDVDAPGTFVLLRADAAPAAVPPPAVAGSPLAGVALPAAAPALEADLSFDRAQLLPSDSALARIEARRADDAPLPSGLPVQAWIDERLVFAGGAERREAPFAVDLVLFRGDRAPSDGGAEFRLSASPDALRAPLLEGEERVRVFPFPEEPERGQLLGSAGGTVVTPDGISLTLPEGALAARAAVRARRLSASELGPFAVAGFRLVAALSVEWGGEVLARPATLELPLASSEAPAAGRLVVAEWIGAPGDGRGALARLVARASVVEGTPRRARAAAEEAGSPLPLDGLVREGTWLLLEANADLAFATGYVRHPSGAPLAGARVATELLGTADLSREGGRYAVPVPAGPARGLVALAPDRDERGEALLPATAAGAVVATDLVVRPVPPRIESRSPAAGSRDVLPGSSVSLLFSEPLDPGSVGAGTLRLEIATPAGAPTGLRLDAAVALAADGRTVVATPRVPLPPGRTLLATFTGGVRDAGGTAWAGPLPDSWTFQTLAPLPNGTVDRSKFRLVADPSGAVRVVATAGAVSDGSWFAWAEVESAPPPPVVASYPSHADGSFDFVVDAGPSVPVGPASRVWIHVRSGGRPEADADFFRVGPLSSPDGVAFWAAPDEETTFVTRDGIAVTVPAAAFDEPTEVRVEPRDPAGVGVEVEVGLAMTGVVELVFEGIARESLRLEVPMPATARENELVLVGRPADTVLGRKFRLLEVGRVVRRGERLVASNDPELQPRPTVTRSVDGKAPSSVPPDLIRRSLAEYTTRGYACFLQGQGDGRVGVAAGSMGTLEYDAILINAVADSFAFFPREIDWNGWYVLPTIPGTTVTIDAVDRTTGWTIGSRSYDPLDGELVDLGSFDPGDGFSPRLLSVAPFRSLRVRVPSVDGECVAAMPGLEACLRGGLIEVAPPIGAPPLPFETGDRFLAIALGCTGWYCQDEAVVTEGGGLSALRVSGEPSGDLLLLVVPRFVDPSEVQRFELTFDRPLRDGHEAREVVDLVDLGPSGSPGAGSSVASDVAFASGRGRLVLRPEGRLSPGRRYRLTLDPAALAGETEGWGGPTRLEFETRPAPSGDVGNMRDSQSLPLGDTGIARDVVRFDNLLVAASAPVVTPIGGTTSTAFALRARLVAIDLSDPTQPRRRAVATEISEHLRAMASDDHGRFWVHSLVHGVWRIVAGDLNDIRGAAGSACDGLPPEWSQVPPLWLGGLGCFETVPGSVNVALGVTASTVLSAGEYLAYAGSMPEGTPTDLAIHPVDEYGTAMSARDFYAAYVAEGQPLFEQLPRDAAGAVTMPHLRFVSTRQRWSSGEPEPSLGRPVSAEERDFTWGGGGCPEAEAEWDRVQRVSVDNLTTGERWSFDIVNDWPGQIANGVVFRAIRARPDDQLRVRYNLRTLGYSSIIGSGLTTTDLNRSWRTPLPEPLAAATRFAGQCGRRLGVFEGQAVTIPPCPSDPPDPDERPQRTGLAMTAAAGVLGTTGPEGARRGEGRIDVFGALVPYGPYRVGQDADRPGAFCESSCTGFEAVCLYDPSTAARVRDIAVAADVRWREDGEEGRTLIEPNGDLALVASGSDGVVVFDVSNRTFRRVGRLASPNRFATKVQVDVARGLVFVAALELGPPPEVVPEAWPSVIEVWDLAEVGGEPPEGSSDPRRLFDLRAAWEGSRLAVDEAGTGFLVTWQNDGAGARVVPLEAPEIRLAGLYAGPGGGVEMRDTSRFVPLGIPTAPQKGHADGAVAAAFRIRTVLPGSLAGDAGVLRARVESLRVRPTNTRADVDPGAALADPGGSSSRPGGDGWPPPSTAVTLRRVGNVAERDGAAWNLFESDEAILLVADPRAMPEYHAGIALQDEPGTEGNACRNCALPDHLEGLPSDSLRRLLAGGPWLQVRLDPEAPENAAVRSFFATHAEAVRTPVAVVQVVGWADDVPSPAQFDGLEPARDPAIWSAGEAGTGVSLASAELLLSAIDLSVRGRVDPLPFSRHYRSGRLGYGPLGAAGWSSPFFARLREIPTTGEILLHDGTGSTWRFLPKGQPLPNGWEADPAGDYAVPAGLDARLVRDPSVGGWRLIERSHGSLLFDGDGRLVEMRDRFHRAASGEAPSSGSVLRFDYDPFARLRSVADEMGRVHRFEYYGDSPADPADKAGLLRSVILGGRRAEFRWDDRRRLVEVVLPPVTNPVEDYGPFSWPAPTVRYSYDPPAGPVVAGALDAVLHGPFAALRLGAMTQPGGSRERIRFEYESSTGRVRRLVVPASNAMAADPGWRFSWLPSGVTTPAITGAVISVPGEAPVTWTLESGRLSTVSRETEAGVETSGLGRDPLGRVVSSVAPDGGTTAIGYATSPADRLAAANPMSITPPATGPTTIDWHLDNTPESISIPGATAGAAPRQIRPGVPTPSASGVTSGFLAEGVVSSSDFDRFGRTTRTRTAGEHPTSTQVDYGNLPGQPGGGWPRRVTQGADLSTTLRHDERGNLVEAKNPLGAGARITVDEWDRPVVERAGFGNERYPSVRVETQRAWDQSGRLVRQRRWQSGVGWVETRWTWNERDQVTSIVETKRANGDPSMPLVEATTELHYDDFGRLDRSVSPGGIATRWTYEAASGRIRTVQVGTTAPRLRQYDVAGRVVLETDGDEGVWRGRYDPAGRLSKEFLPSGAVRTHVYDAAGNPVATRLFDRDPEADPDAVLFSETTSEITSFGAPSRIEETLAVATDERPGQRKVTERRFDASGAVVEVWSSDGEVDAQGRPRNARRDWQGAYDPAGRLSAEVDAVGNVTEWVYDATAPWPVASRHLERFPDIADPVAMEIRTFQRDALGRVLSETSSAGRARSARWDEAGNLLGLLEKVGSSGERSRGWTWDGAGRLLLESRPEGRGQTAYGYDRDGRPVVRSHRTDDGTPLWETAWRYDEAGRLARTDHADGSWEGFGYNGDGTLREWSRRDGLVVTNEYDPSNRLLSRTVEGTPAPSTVPLDAGDRWGWDRAGRLLEATRPDAPNSNVGFGGWDAGGRPAFETVGHGGPLERGYDPWGRTVRVSLPAAATSGWGSFTGWSRSFDAADRPVATAALGTSPLGASWTRGSARGLSQTTAGGTTHRWRWSGEPGVTTGAPVGQLAALEWATAGGLVGSLVPGYRTGDLAKTSRASSGPLGRDLGWDWTLDAAERLTAAEIPSPAGGAPLARFSVLLDEGDRPLAFRRDDQGEVRACSSGPNGRLTEFDGAPVTHDPSGKRTSDGRLAYGWDWRDRLVSVDVAATGERILWADDSLGRPRLRTRLGLAGAGGARPHLETRTYSWDGQALVSEAAWGDEAATVPRWRYSWLPGESGLDDAPQVQVETWSGLGAPASTKVYGYLRDELGTVTGLVEESTGRLVRRYLWTPWGEAHVEWGPEVRRVAFDGEVTSVATPAGQVSQGAVDLPGAIRIALNGDSDPASWGTGWVLERRESDGSWGALAASAWAVGWPDADRRDEVAILVRAGWERSTTWRVRWTSDLRDTTGRSPRDSWSAEWTTPASGPVFFERTESVAFGGAAAQDEDAEFPGGQPLRFQGAWTDPATGLAYHRARWYDPRTGEWLSEDPLDDVDSPNLYAGFAHRAHEMVDPLGTRTQAELNDLYLEDVKRLGRPVALLKDRARRLLAAEQEKALAESAQYSSWYKRAWRAMTGEGGRAVEAAAAAYDSGASVATQAGRDLGANAVPGSTSAPGQIIPSEAGRERSPSQKVVETQNGLSETATTAGGFAARSTYDEVLWGAVGVIAQLRSFRAAQEFDIAPHRSQPRPRGGLASHHGIQREYGIRNIPGYDPGDAPTILLDDSRGGPHRRITGAQASRRAEMSAATGNPYGADYGSERAAAIEQMRKNGVPEAKIGQWVLEHDGYLFGLGGEVP